MKKQELISWVCIAVIFALLIIFSFSCNVQKHVREETRSFDSSYLKTVQDSVRVLRNENEYLQSEIRQLQYAGVQFDTGFINGKTDTDINAITITKDGEIKATGKILTAYVSKSALTKIVQDNQARIDSFSRALSIEKKNIKTVTEVKTVDKVVKSPFPWIWMIVVAVSFYFLGAKTFPGVSKLFQYWFNK